MENNELWRCPRCGREGNDGKFCSECGAARPTPSSPLPLPEPAPVNSDIPDDFTPEDRKKANILCVISLVLMFVASFVFTFIMMGINSSDIPTGISEALSAIFGFLTTGSEVAALAIMIYVRVKYKQSVFGKVLMWLYIIIGIMILIGAILLISICIYEWEKCANGVW